MKGQEGGREGTEKAVGRGERLDREWGGKAIITTCEKGGREREGRRGREIKNEKRNRKVGERNGGV